MNSPFAHIISIRSFTREHILEVLRLAEQMEAKPPRDLLVGHVLGILFFEPSTRTRLSFVSAMLRMGGQVLDFGEVQRTSLQKGETFKDTVRMLSGYCDVIAIRHSLEGAAKLASEIGGIPIINAGDGANQHPTQTFLDLYTIHKNHGRIDGLSVGLIGDLKYGRTVHSLVNALCLFDCELYFISPQALRIPPHVRDDLRDRGVRVLETHTLENVLPRLDVLYCTRIQQERFADMVEYERVRGSFRVDRELLEKGGAKPGLKVLHPLPRVDELSEDVDDTSFAAYFEQARNGIPVRQALLALVLRKV